MTESPIIELIRRDARTLNCSFWYYDSSGVRQPLDISGMVLRFTVKAKKTDADADAIIGPITGSITSGPLGTATISLSGAESGQTDVPDGVYNYDLQLSSSGIPQSTRAGQLVVYQDITGVS